MPLLIPKLCFNDKKSLTLRNISPERRYDGIVEYSFTRPHNQKERISLDCHSYPADDAPSRCHEFKKSLLNIGTNI